MTPAALTQAMERALVVSVGVSLPALLAAAGIGLFVAAFQAASQIQDPTLAHLPRLFAVMAALLVLGPWMGREVAAFAMHVLESATPR